MSEGSRYSKNIELLPADHPYRLIASQLSAGNTVLDIGCGSGELGAFLSTKRVIVDGIEPNLERADIAKSHLRHIFCGKAGPESQGLTPPYTAVTMLDVIEHLADPIPLLQWASTLSNTLFLFIPNAAHFSARIKVLRGDWEYADAGLFDRDHLRFYDLRTMRTLLETANLKIDQSILRYSVPRHLSKSIATRWPNAFASAALIQCAPRRPIG